jgi:hypothetical protein
VPFVPIFPLFDPLFSPKFRGSGQLWAMEVDPDSALDEFRELVKGALGPPADPDAKSGGGMMGNMGLPDFKGEISEMLSGHLLFCLPDLTYLYCTER